MSVFSGQTSCWSLDIGSCVVTGLPVELHRYLTQSAVQTPDEVGWADEILNQAHPTLEAAVRVGSDVVRAGFVFKRTPLQPDETRTDRFGVTWANFDRQPTTIHYPFEHLTARQILHQPRPNPNQFQVIAPDLNTDHAIMCDVPISSIFEQACRLRGYGKFQEDFVDNPRLVSALLDYVLEMAIEWYDNILIRLPVAPDLILVAEDLGYQKSLAISPEIYRAFIKPRQRQLIHHLKRRSEAQIVLHSCGAIGPILKDLCQLEVDALHVQPGAKNMHPSCLRRVIPKDMVLYGMLDVAAWFPSLVSGDKAASAELLNYLETCQPVVVGPTDLIPSCFDPQHFAQGVTKLAEVVRLSDK